MIIITSICIEPVLKFKLGFLLKNLKKKLEEKYHDQLFSKSFLGFKKYNTLQTVKGRQGHLLLIHLFKF